MRQAAEDPEGPVTTNRDALRHGLRSVHLKNIQVDDPAAKVRRPVHLIYFRVARSGLIEMVRVLHERMEARRHIQPN